MKEVQRQNPNQSRPERTEAAGNISVQTFVLPTTVLGLEIDKEAR